MYYDFGYYITCPAPHSALQFEGDRTPAGNGLDRQLPPCLAPTIAAPWQAQFRQVNVQAQIMVTFPPVKWGTLTVCSKSIQ